MSGPDVDGQRVRRGLVGTVTTFELYPGRLWTTRSGPSAAGTSRNSSRATSRFDEAEHPEFPELRAPARSRLA